MKPLWLTFAVLLLTATLAFAQRPSQNDNRPSSPTPSGAPASAPSAPSTSTYTGGGGSSHSSPPPGNSGGSMGNSSSHSNSGGSAGGSSAHSTAGSSGTNTRSDRSNSGGNNTSRSDHSSTNNTHAPERHGPPVEGSRNAPADSRLQPNRPLAPPSDAPGSARSGRETRHEPNANRDHRSDPTLHKPVATPRQSSGDTNPKKHFHWFWQRAPRNTEENDLAKRGHPDLKKPTPCKGNNCKPECPAGQAPGEAGRCAPFPPPNTSCNGTVDRTGNCITTDPCANNVYGSNCQQNQNRYLTRPDCSGISSQIELVRLEIERLTREQQFVCGQDPAGTACRQVTDDLRDAEERMRRLQAQYSSCMSSQSRLP